MSLNVNSITIAEFCDLQGVNSADKFVLIKQNKAEETKTYNEWYDIAAGMFRMTEKKKFNQKSVKETVKNEQEK